MAYRPGNKNFVVATDTDNTFAIRFNIRGPQVAVDTLSAGDFIIYEASVWPVYSTTAMGSDKTELVLGFGNFYDPHLVLNDSDLVIRADPAIWEAIDMQVAMPDSTASPPPTTMAVPTSISEDGLTCLINITPAWLRVFQQMIDYAEGGPSGMSLPYDLVGVFNSQRTRVLTGTIVITRSAASSPVPPPNPEGEGFGQGPYGSGPYGDPR